MLAIMSSILNMEFVQALNPLYAFPIVAVIICAFIVYALGFKSPVQPPSFDGIEEEKKVNRKRKAKDSTKGKVIQNGKLNGSTSNAKQAHVSPSSKKNEKSSVKPVEEKSVNEKKASKKTKQSNEKKVSHEKKENFSPIHEDVEDGWVQLVSKKGRKNRKKEEITSIENQTRSKPLKSSNIDKHVGNNIADIITEDIPAKIDVAKKPIPEKKPVLKKEEDIKVLNVENNEDKVMAIEAESTLYESSLNKAPLNDLSKSDKLHEETTSKSKKKKKKILGVENADNDSLITPPPPPLELPAVQVIPEAPSQNAAVITDVSEITGQVQNSEPLESKSSNVVFDELAELYPKEKELRKKKKVRRDH